ncbi:Signal transduction histidine kinase [Yoonia tamlensis]|uniref:histidine kinase n=1 Tax=Yoonia tamlensis TaxID=390270 RepID=A0A1I6FPX6_9RHOB|nr:ATP-binding protein [Yoonia tamlensis]SFR32003.1 Signal transduction histidine kinase [Yoonia tamlensis]
MPRRVISKWRPPLGLVLGGTLAAVFFLPLIGIGYFRVAGGVLGWAETAWMIGWMAFVATAVLGFLLWRLVLRPLRTLTQYAQAEGAAEVPVHFGTPEFSKLGQSVIAMTETLQGREAVLRSYADHVTHELKSPLSAIRGAAELLASDQLSAADRAKLVGNVSLAAARIQDLLDDQQEFVRAHDQTGAGVSQLSELVAKWPCVLVAQDGQVPLSANVGEVVMTHLIGNALQHGATRVTVALSGDCLLVSDDGPGISEGNRSRIFDPFFTTNRDKGGTGMGLAIVRRILHAHGADIRLRDGAGAVFEISF